MAATQRMIDILSDFPKDFEEDFMQEPSLELDRLAKRLVSEDGIASAVLARQAIDEYKKFFLLCTISDNEQDVLVPSPLVDMVWQRHQLDTAPYFEDSRAFCMPGGYLHRHAVKNSSASAARESKAGETADFSLAEVSIAACYERTLLRYEEVFEAAPDPQMWPADAFSAMEGDATCVVSAGVAIPHAAISAAQGPAVATAGEAASEGEEDALVAELLWVGELVRAELPYKQARCPGQGEPIQQIRFHPHCDCFVPSAAQEQERLVKVVREYVRFLKMAMKQHYGAEEEVGEEVGEVEEVAAGAGAGADGQAEEVQSAVQGERAEAKKEEKGKRAKPAFQVTPSKLVDELWHAHVLHSPAYFQFCARHAPGGRYVHHEPHFDKPPNFHEPGFEQTLLAYKEQFGCPPGDIWGVLGESGGGGGGCGRGCGGGGCGRGCGGGGGCGRGCGGGGGCGRGCGGGGGCGGSACGVGGGSWGARAILSPRLSCGACSATNGNGNQSYEAINSARAVIYTLETPERSNKTASIVLSLKYTHNQTVNAASMYVMARSNLRVFCYLTVRYGMVVSSPLRMAILFARTASDPRYLYLTNAFVSDELYCHIQRQIYLAEAAMCEAACQMAQLRKAQLLEAKKVHGTTVECRKALVREWWSRHGPCKELLDAMNVLLAPFNVRLAKKLETSKNSMYDHYLLLPALEPWSPPAATLPGEIMAHYAGQWEALRASMLARKAVLDKQWMKAHKQWENEVYTAQTAWLQTVNGQLAAQRTVAYIHCTASAATEACWDLRFANVVDVPRLIHANALSDRTYLRSVFADIHPNIQVPASYLPNAALAGAPTILAPQSRLVTMIVTVPAGTGAGDTINITEPSSGQLFTCQVPAGMTPGMKFPLTVTVGSGQPVAPLPLPPAQTLAPSQAAPAPAAIQMTVTVPATSKPGDTIAFVVPATGQTVQCVVPLNTYAGMTFTVSVGGAPVPLLGSSQQAGGTYAAPPAMVPHSPAANPAAGTYAAPPMPVANPESAPPPRTLKLSIAVPAQSKAGDLVRFRTPAGREMEARVPAGLQPGMQFLVSVSE